MASESTDQASSPLLLSENRYPTGWFQVGWSDELAPGQVTSLTYFGQDIVVWRGQSGELHACDAYCLHLGGHLGVQGTVVGEEIKCPWHGWQWDGEGSNTLIPFSSQKCKPNLRLRMWTVQDWYGCIMVWHDLADRPPLWPLDTIDDLEGDEFLPMLPSCRVVHRIRAHPQLPLENSCDVFHVAFVHGGDAAEPVNMVFDEYCCYEDLAITYGGGKNGSWLTPDGEARAIIKARMWGIGNTWLRFPSELMPGVQLTNVTPVDDTYSDYYFAMSTRRSSDNLEAEEPGPLERRFVDLQMKVIEQDFFTWENMKVLHQPNFAVEEAKFYATLRRWCARFYPDPNDAPPDRLRFNDDDSEHVQIVLTANGALGEQND